MFRTTIRTAIRNGAGYQAAGIAARVFNLRNVAVPSHIVQRQITLRQTVNPFPFQTIFRHQSTQAEKSKPSTDFDMKIESKIYTHEREYTDLEKECIIPLEEAETPNVIKPFIYFIGVGAISFFISAWLTVEDTRRAVKNAEEQIELLPSLHEKFTTEKKENNKDDWFTRIEADKEAHWGAINETDLCVIEKAELQAKQPAKERRIQYWCDLLHIPEEYKQDVIRRSRRRLDSNIKGFKEQNVSFAVTNLLLVVFVGIKLSRKGILGKNTFNMMKNHILQIPASDRLHTLTTSTFSHARWGSFLLNSLLIAGLGDFYFRAPYSRKDLNGQPLHTVERSAWLHFFAFCITAGTFASCFSQAFTRLMLIRVKYALGPQAAKRMIGRTPKIGSAGITYSLAAMSIPDSFINRRQKNKEEEDLDNLVPMLFSVCLTYNLTTMSSSLAIGQLIRSGDAAARIGGSIFGLAYYEYGNTFWERTKSIFYTKEEKLMFTTKPELEQF